ncbi:alanine racemase [Helicobacter pametensis]|uniref:alanine racemase n=1 Tax=Helicobacter pametensis TaxID=95149 RepID=UPI000481D29F|nr:alanine racemase [Helicobacter pametensis]
MAQLIIDSSHFKHNLDLISSHLGSIDKLALVLKDNAYGHGIKEIAKLARDYGIKSVFVKNEMEALMIQDEFEHITALYGSISPTSPTNIYQTIHSIQMLKSISPQRGIELKFNVGMNRNGLEIKQIQQAIQLILERKLKLVGVFSHNGYGDDGGDEMQKQHQTSQEIKEQITYLASKLGFELPRFHFLSSSGALRQEKIEEDLVRIGIASYGYLCAPIPIASKLKPIASLWAHQISKRTLEKEIKIGYSGAGVMPRDHVISTYDLGYGDGLLRLNEHHGRLTCAQGEEILPRMSMDCFSCLSDQEKICVFDNAWKWAEIFGTTPYDILVKLSPSIPRSII